MLLLLPQRYVFSSKSQRHSNSDTLCNRCCCYHKGTYFQANHNRESDFQKSETLLLLPQRYVFSSKSQRNGVMPAPTFGCCCYHKGTYFQANHNVKCVSVFVNLLLLLPQRYVFSSKSQQVLAAFPARCRCCCYHKGTYFQANHNASLSFRINVRLLLLPQRYVFSSKSQRTLVSFAPRESCCCYHKGTYFQANHNRTNEHN